MTVKEIIESTGYSECTVRKYIKENNLKVNSRRSKITDDVIAQIQKLVEEGKTNKEIALELKMSPTTTRKYTVLCGKETNSVKNKPLKTEELILSKEQLEILYGTLLGDASIGMQWNEARVSFTQGGNQEVYFNYKCSFFKDLLGKINKSKRYDKRTNKYYSKYSVRFKCHKFFTEMYKKLYPNGIKTVTKEWLVEITPRGLAFWFMDDGSNCGVLATNCFSYEECMLIKDWFKNKYDIDVTIQNQKNKGGIQHIIYVKASSRPNFYNLVKPYIIPEMEYKFINWNP